MGEAKLNRRNKKSEQDWHNRTGKSGRAKQIGQNRSGKTRQAKQGKQNRIGRTRQVELGWAASIREPGQDSHGQDSRNTTGKVDRQNNTDMTGWDGQGSGVTTRLLG